MEWQMEQDKDNNLVLRLAGRLTVENARELREALGAALAKSKRVRVELAGDVEADLCGLQLFCAAHRSSLAGGGRFRIDQAAEHFRQAARRAGLPRQQGCTANPDNQCLWLGGNFS